MNNQDKIKRLIDEMNMLMENGTYQEYAKLKMIFTKGQMIEDVIRSKKRIADKMIAEEKMQQATPLQEEVMDEDYEMLEEEPQAMQPQPRQIQRQPMQQPMQQQQQQFAPRMRRQSPIPEEIEEQMQEEMPQRVPERVPMQMRQRVPIGRPQPVNDYALDTNYPNIPEGEPTPPHQKLRAQQAPPHHPLPPKPSKPKRNFDFTAEELGIQGLPELEGVDEADIPDVPL